MRHCIVYFVLNNKTSRCLKTFYDKQEAFYYCRKMKHKGKICRLVCVNLDRNIIENNTSFEGVVK